MKVRPLPVPPEVTADSAERVQHGSFPAGMAATIRSRRKEPGSMTTSLHVERRLPADFLADSLRADALAGLTAAPKTLPPKWFYDAAGSELFEKITALPEYYPTRAEREILQAVAPQIAAASGAATLIELGSGSSEKTRLLIDALREAGTLRRYVPVDVSEQALLAAATALFSDYPGLEVSGVVSDFEEYVGLLGAGDGSAGEDSANGDSASE